MNGKNGKAGVHGKVQGELSSWCPPNGNQTKQLQRFLSSAGTHHQKFTSYSYSRVIITKSAGRFLDYVRQNHLYVACRRRTLGRENRHTTRQITFSRGNDQSELVCKILFSPPIVAKARTPGTVRKSAWEAQGEAS